MNTFHLFLKPLTTLAYLARYTDRYTYELDDYVYK